MSKKKILLIEPDNVLSQAVTTGLIRSSYSVTQCKTAQHAINTADKENFDLVICELMLVSHSGIEFLYEFRSYNDWQNVPVIIFSSVPPSEFSVSRNGLSRELSVSVYLYKPHTSLKKLLQSVDSLLAVPTNENS